jgi:diaminohydroxyphosphoribosylaminopyrimidine deaminase/5-amino-6-(5-phosphoribosylamino)uracil reductase
MFSTADHAYMAQALRLAERGLYTTMPNPRVGCVIVNDGEVIGEGVHLRAGEPHAEVHALRMAAASAPEKVKGADVYVTLEPCGHHGRTPPCAEALVQAGVKRVVAAMQDPNPLVAGKGLAYLTAHGIATASGLMEQQARELNPGFIMRMTQARPFVRSKIAASLDGRTALSNGISKWITGEAARYDVQRWRARSSAIMTGIDTVLADDPQLDVRSPELGIARQPLRVVVDSRLRISPQARILQGGGTLIAYASDPDDKARGLREAGVELMQLTDAHGRVCLTSLLQALAQREINELMVEAGPALNGALLEAGLIDELLLYYAPVLMGSAAKPMAALSEFTRMSQRLELQMLDSRLVGSDMCLRARPKPAKE